MKKVAQDMNIGMVDLAALDEMRLEDVQLIYKRVTGKGISVNVAKNKQWFIDKLTALKHI
jgi:hypothetical protein